MRSTRKKSAAVRASSARAPALRIVADAGSTQEIALADGATVKVHDGAVAEVRDACDRLLVRYENGRAEIAAPAGDLVLSAPGGRVVVRAASDVVIEAERDLLQRAGQRAGVEARKLHVKSGEAHLETAQATVVAERILTTARVLAHNVERFEVTATRLLEKTRETYREAADLLQTRAGRLRTLVEDTYSLHARRTTIVSKEETSIDGKKVLLG
jgi:hypothetical protein